MASSSSSSSSFTSSPLSLQLQRSGNSTRSSTFHFKSIAITPPHPLSHLGTHFLSLRTPPTPSSSSLCAYANGPRVFAVAVVGPLRLHTKPDQKRRNNNQFQLKNEPNSNHNQLNNQNQRDPLQIFPPNFDLMSLCEEGRMEEALEFTKEGVSADYEFFRALLNSCRDSKSLEVGKRVHEFLKRLPFRGDVELNNKVIEVYGNVGT